MNIKWANLENNHIRRQNILAGVSRQEEENGKKEKKNRRVKDSRE